MQKTNNNFPEKFLEKSRKNPEKSQSLMKETFISAIFF
jgi:hypothetical protein